MAPWWAARTKVLVCRDSYRPEVRKESYASCDGEIEERSPCRCGAYLLNCARDDEQARAVKEAAHREVLDTIAAVIRDRRSFDDIIVMGESARTGYGEFSYVRSDFLTHGRADFDVDWERTTPVLKPRTADYAVAGILTTPVLLWYADSRRQTMAYLWEDLLCEPLRASGITAAQMLAHVNAANFRVAEQPELAQQPGCRNCHARLEWPVGAFKMYTSSRVGNHVVPLEGPPPPSRLYVRDHTDLRASGEATPAWVGATLAKQPEFAECMVRKVERSMLGAVPFPPAAHAELMDVFRSRHDLLAVAERAVLMYLDFPTDLPARPDR